MKKSILFTMLVLCSGRAISQHVCDPSHCLTAPKAECIRYCEERAYIVLTEDELKSLGVGAKDMKAILALKDSLNLTSAHISTLHRVMSAGGFKSLSIRIDKRKLKYAYKRPPKSRAAKHKKSVKSK